MTENKIKYNTNLAKGTGFVNETLTLINYYQRGQEKQAFLKECLLTNILDKATEKRTKDLITLVFYDRYWKKGNVILLLQLMREKGASLSVMKKLFLVFTARANLVLYDFLKIIYEANLKHVELRHALDFINEAISSGLAPSWSEAMIKRTASYLLSCLRDFDLIGKGNIFLKSYPEMIVVNFFLHEMHFSGQSDMQILDLVKSTFILKLF